MGRPTLDAVIQACEDDRNTGFCIECGEEAYGCEPDMQREKCHSCGSYDVYGGEQIIIAGLYVDDEDHPKANEGTPFFKRTTRKAKPAKTDGPKPVRAMSVRSVLATQPKHNFAGILNETGILTDTHFAVRTNKTAKPRKNAEKPSVAQLRIVCETLDVMTNGVPVFPGDPEFSESLGYFVTWFCFGKAKTRVCRVNSIYLRTVESLAECRLNWTCSNDCDSVIGQNSLGQNCARIMRILIDEE